MKHKRVILVAVLLLTVARICFAQDTLKQQDTTSKQQDTLKQPYPAAILVQLRSEHNRIEALKKERRYAEAAEVQKDAEEVTNRMMSDFHDNFNYCPVYFYSDTNMELVKHGKLDGILINYDGSPAKNFAVAKDNYMIVFYGYPVDQSYFNQVVTDSIKYMVNSGETSGKGLILNDADFRQIGYVYKLGINDLFLGKKKAKYFYSSQHFDIEYFPLASLLNKQLVERRKHKVKTRYKEY